MAHSVTRSDACSCIARWAIAWIALECVVAFARDATAGPVVSPASDVGRVVNGAAWGSQSSPAIAFGAGEFLATWEDGREAGSITHVFAARVALDGTVLDPVGIPVCIAAGNQGSPGVAFDGSNFWVAWSDTRAPGTLTAPQVYAARVAPDGRILDPDGVLVGPAAQGSTVSLSATTGGGAVALWMQGAVRGAGTQLVLARITPAGVVLDRPAVPVESSASQQDDASLASDGTNLFVFWRDWLNGAPPTESFLARRFDMTLRPLDASHLVILPSTEITTTSALPGTVAWSGGNFVAPWEQDGNLAAVRIASSGTLLDAAPIAIARGRGTTTPPVAVPYGADTLVTWADEPTLLGPFTTQAVRLGADGSVRDSTPIVMTTAATGSVPSAATTDGSSVMIAEQFGTQDDADAFLTRVIGPGVPSASPPTALSTSAESERNVALAADGDEYLATWEQSRSTDAGARSAIAMARITPDGTVLPGAGTLLSTEGSEVRNPAVAAGAGMFLDVWVQTDPVMQLQQLLGVRIAHDGTILDATPITLASSPSSGLMIFRLYGSPSVAYDGAAFVVAWFEYGYDFGAVEVLRVSTAGAVTVAERSSDFNAWITVAGGPVVLSNGNGSMVAYWGTGSEPGAGVRYALYGRDGHIAATQPSVLDGTSTDMASAFTGASDGDGYSLFWAHSTASSTVVRGAHVDPTGGIVDASGFDVLSAPTPATSLSAGFDGNEFMLAWTIEPDRWTSSVLATRVLRDTTVLDPMGTIVSSGPRAERAPAVMSVGDGTSIIADHTLVTDAPFGSDRIHARVYSVRSDDGGVVDGGDVTASDSGFDAIVSADAFSDSGSDVPTDTMRTPLHAKGGCGCSVPAAPTSGGAWFGLIAFLGVCWSVRRGRVGPAQRGRIREARTMEGRSLRIARRAKRRRSCREQGRVGNQVGFSIRVVVSTALALFVPSGCGQAVSPAPVFCGPLGPEDVPDGSETGVGEWCVSASRCCALPSQTNLHFCARDAMVGNLRCP